LDSSSQVVSLLIRVCISFFHLSPYNRLWDEFRFSSYCLFFRHLLKDGPSRFAGLCNPKNWPPFFSQPTLSPLSNFPPTFSWRLQPRFPVDSPSVPCLAVYPLRTAFIAYSRISGAKAAFPSCGYLECPFPSIHLSSLPPQQSRQRVALENFFFCLVPSLPPYSQPVPSRNA